jgi:hypothetical protein
VLNREVFAAVADPAPTGAAARENFAFFESYFSNYIEGTTAFDRGVPREQLSARLALCNAFEEDLKSYRLVFTERAG